MLFGGLNAVTGRIITGYGQGYDGIAYGRALISGYDVDAGNTPLRPVVVLINRQVLRLVLDASNADARTQGTLAVTVFAGMNFVYTAVLGFGLSVLFARYNDDLGARLLFIANVFLCIATAKMFAYYPVLVDLGAHAIMVLAVCAICADRRVAAFALCIAAALSREFAVGVALFGIHRDLRRRNPPWKAAATYGPALVAFVWWRQIVIARFPQVLSPWQLLHNLHVWADPQFIAVFGYFMVTLLGGVTVLVFVSPGVVTELFRREHEWLTLAATTMAAAAVGDADIWRYLAFLLPVLTVLFARCARALDLPRGNVAAAAFVLLATLITQRPWQAIDDLHYFRDWFPYYLRHAPDIRIKMLWAFRMGVSIWLLLMMRALVARHPASSVRSMPADSSSE